jgi:anti-anti-sigma factor
MENKMDIRQTRQGSQGVLSLAGRFDFNAHREFKEAYTALLADGGIQSLDINFSNVDYLDSSALGMLLMLRERAEATNKKITISKPTPTVIKIFDIANFSKLFTINQ